MVRSQMADHNKSIAGVYGQIKEKLLKSLKPSGGSAERNNRDNRKFRIFLVFGRRSIIF